MHSCVENSNLQENCFASITSYTLIDIHFNGLALLRIIDQVIRLDSNILRTASKRNSISNSCHKTKN